MYLRSVPILQTNMPTQRRKSSKYNLTLHLLMRYKKVTCQFLWKLLFKIVDTASLSRVSEQASGNFKSFISLYKNGYLSKQNLKFLVKITLPYWVEDKQKNWLHRLYVKQTHPCRHKSVCSHNSSVSLHPRLW